MEMMDGDDYRRPGVVIEEGSVLPKALAAKRRVPIRNLKKRPRSSAAGGWTRLPAGVVDDDLPPRRLSDLPQPSREHRL